MFKESKESSCVVSLPKAFTISGMELADRLGVSLRHLRRMDSSGKIPRPVRFGKCIRWRLSEIESWLESGAPDRKTWEQVKKEVM